ncbi:protocadherin Fat 2 [Crotalus adamanteus]|uniref:Protocadherin Fat 2 n=1 Tax=Crotalus adamanteus TaxID=8729 RepID=A0AAW1BXP5_CROAD
MNVPEDLPLGTTLLFLEAFDPDTTSEGELKYSLISDNNENMFHLNEFTGALTLEKELDYEKLDFYNLSVKISDSGKPYSLSSLCYIEINVLDINENLHPPSFDSFVYEGSVEENSPEGTPVMGVVARDGDRGKDGQIQYFIREGSGMALFNIENDTGLIFTMGPLDRELCSHYWLTVLAVDQGSVSLSSVVEIYIEISDINDNPPQMSRPVFYSSVSENSPANTSILQVEAIDPDTDSQGKLTFHIINGNHQGFFAINPFTGLIYTTSEQLDREYKAEHILEVSVSDNGDPVLQSSSRVVIQVLDVNDNPPSFSQKLFMVQLPEKAASETPLPVYRVIAADRDEGLNCQITYSLEENSEGLFSIHTVTGIVFSQKAFSAQEYNILTVKATDGGTPQLSSSVRLHIDWIPKPLPSSELLAFDEPHFNFAVMETDPVNHMVGVISVDAGLSQIWFNITGGDDAMNFDIEKSTGSIIIARTLDAKERSNYNLTIEVTDGSSIIKTQAYIHVIDINQHPPQFSEYQYEARIPEDTPPGTELFFVSATDQDHGKGLIYTLHNSLDPRSLKLFQIDPSRGTLITVSHLDAQSMPLHTLTVMVRDQDVPIKRDFARIVIHIEGCNNHPPQFTSLHYKAEILDVTPIGTEVVQIRALDPDQGVNAEVHYCFEAGNNGNFFTISKLSGIITVSQKLDQSKQERFTLAARSPEGLRLIYTIVEKDVLRQFHIDFKTGMLMVTSQLDYESDTKHTFTVRATETAAGSYSEAIVEVHVEDVNDNFPLFSQTVYTVYVSEDMPAQTPVIQLSVTDQDSGWNKLISYQILKDRSDASKFFSIDGSTGEITTTRALDYETNHEFHIKVRATDHGIPPLSSEVLVIVNVLDINDNPPKFSQLQYQTNVSKMVSCGQVVVKVQAFDPDSRDTPRLEYMILSGNEKRHFTIDGTSGIISTLNHCKKNLESFYSLRVSASDGVFKTTVPVYINTTNVNKYSPAFQQDVYEAVLAENAKIGTKVIELSAIDPDDGAYGTIDYIIINKLGQEKFLIDDKGRIETLQKLDRENSTERVVDIKIMAKDGGGKVAFCTVKIILTDENDNPPQFKASEYLLSIQSNMRKGSPVIQVLAYDADEGVNADVTYSVDTMEEVTAEDVIEINTVTGVVIVKESLKGLENRTVKFRVKAEDAKPPHWHSVVPVNLQVVPKEMSLPRFSEPLYTFSASEDLPEGSEIGSVRAIGEEPIIYSLVQGTSAENNEEGIFTLDKQRGTLTVQKAMDYEEMKWYQVEVLAHSSYKNTDLVSLASINIHVKDVNDNKPIFEADPYRAFVMENMPAGTPVIQITANDQDTGSDGQVTYSLGSELSYIREFFTIDSGNGWIMTLKELDCEVQKSYKFFVVASDHGKKIQLSSQTLVEVTVTDENDNAPEFTNEIYKGSVVENAEPGQMITILNTIDRDLSEENRQVMCYITEGDVMGQFGISEVDGKWKVFSKKPLNREETEKYVLKVMVSDGKFQAATEVEILVLDVNDNSPECKQTLYEGKISENESPGFSVLKVLATDVDAGSNSQITYSLHGVGAEDFRLDSYTGELTTSTLLDRELKSKYHLVAKATDGGGRFCQMEITVHVEDTNDNAPMFYPSHCAVAIYENTSIKTPIVVVFAKDPDEILNGEVRYHLAESANGHFSIDEITGVIRLEKPLKESHSVLELTVLAKDRGVPQSLSSFTTVTVSVVDLKEYLPVFLNTEYLVEVKENVAVGTEVLNLSTLTRATVANTEIRYEITNGNDLGKFRLHSSTGILYVNGTLDFEVAHDYYLTIEGIRKTSTSLSDVTMVIINITDINDHMPEFDQDLYIADISEDAAIGEIVLMVLANDKDGVMNNQITYSIVEGNSLGHFMINPKAGEIYTTKHLDREEISSYSLKIQAMDNGQAALSSDTIVLIHVSDVNDNPPRFFQLNYSVAVQENSPVGTSVLELIMSDRDSPENGPPYIFQIVEGNEGRAFQVNQDGVLVTSSILNRRTKEQYLLQVQVVDSGLPPLSSSAFINIHVIQQSQYPPSALPLEIFITTNERIFRGGVLGKIHATDRDPHDTLLYSFVSVVPEKKHFSVGLSDGKIIATDGLQHGHYSLNVSVSDGTFSTITRVQIHVWSFSQDALDKAVMLHFRHLNPEEFISDHWRNLQRFLGSILETKRQNVHMASLQPSQASDGVDLLLAVGEPQYSFYKPSFIADRISQSAEEMDQRVGLRVKKVTYVPCHEANCIIQRACKETFQVEPGTVFTYSTARLSVLTPRHSLEQICTCNGTALRFSGHSYIWYHHQGKRDWQMHFHLQTHQLHAILLSTNGSNSAVLQLVNGVPHLGYRCRSGFSANLSSHRFVSDRVWHSVFLEVKSRSIHFLVDDMVNASLHLPESCSVSHSTRDLLIGGLVQHHQPQRITGGFKGCLNTITVDGRNLVVLPKEKRSRGVVEESSIRQCCPHTGACSSNPCLNDGLCSEVQHGGYFCTCSTQFSGDHCEVADGLCQGNTCLHGGTCELTKNGGYICHCPEKYWGGRCEKVAEKCLKNPCQNSARCVNSEGSPHCICTDHFQGTFCTRRIGIPTISPPSEIWKPEGIAKISAGVLGIVILVIAIIIIHKCYCHKVKAHKPVAKEDPDLLSKSEFSKSVGVGTQGISPIELNILNNGPHNHFSALDPDKPSVVPEFTAFNSSNIQKQRGAIVCSVAPNLPAAPLLSNSDNDSTLKSSWTGDKMVYPGETTYWPPRYQSTDTQEYHQYEVIETPLPPSPCHRPPPPPPLPVDSDPAGLYGGFPFPLDQSNKRAPIPPRYSNQNLEDFLPPGSAELASSKCQNEYTAISYYPSQLVENEGPLYHPDNGYKRVSMRLSVAQPSYADCEIRPIPNVRTQPTLPSNYEGSDMVESDYGSCEEVMF